MSFIFLFHIVIIRFSVYTQETVEFHNFSRGTESLGCIAYTDGRCCLFQFGICHLRSNGTFPDQVV